MALRHVGCVNEAVLTNMQALGLDNLSLIVRPTTYQLGHIGKLT